MFMKQRVKQLAITEKSVKKKKIVAVVIIMFIFSIIILGVGSKLVFQKICERRETAWPDLGTADDEQYEWLTEAYKIKQKNNENLDNQEHSVKNVSSLIKLLSDNNIPIEAPILEKKESFFGQVKIKVIGPTVQDMVRVAKRIETHYCKEHSGRLYLGNISDAEDKYKPDTSETNNASIIMVIEHDNKKLLFTGDSSAENIITAVNKYYQNTWFDIFKLPHHGSQHNISRELIKRIKANKYIISTNKTVEKVVLLRMVEENETTELLCNYNWWNLGYFTDDDLTRYINTGIIVLTDIGEEKVII